MYVNVYIKNVGCPFVLYSYYTIVKASLLVTVKCTYEDIFYLCFLRR